MAGRVTEAARVLILAAIVTGAMAAPVLLAPSERLFGTEIAGRHHDPFTVMQQFERPSSAGVYAQPVTDGTGAILARVWNPVAAYNGLVLLSFPLSAVAAFLLGRHLLLSPAAALFAAMAYAFSPFHLAQAAYHPHIAQTQWLPVYLLALWRCLAGPSPAALGFLAAAAVTVTLSNFYGGLIAAVMTPVAVLTYWVLAGSREAAVLRRVAITSAALVLIAATGAAYAWYAGLAGNPAAFGFPRADLFRYSAKWWSYLVPQVGHPIFGSGARHFWETAGVREGLLEQQVSLGWGVIALAVIAITCWAVEGRSVPSADASAALVRKNQRVWVPVLAVMGLAALVCSLSPERTVGGFTFVRPSALLYDVVPMFRSYARFGVIVQLMSALLAGIGIDYLRRPGTMRRHLAAALIAVAACEYAIWPPALWRDVLPTRAHRWVARQPGPVRALDCAPLTQESSSIRWLTGDRVALEGGAVDDCTEPDLPRKLAAAGFTHLIVRRGIPESESLDDRALPDGLRTAARFADGRVFAVTAPAPAIYTEAMTGFFAREHAGRQSWRWMGAAAQWTVVNTRPVPVAATLAVELTAFHRPRTMDVMLDGRCVLTIVVAPERGVHHLGPLRIDTGRHELGFHAVEPVAPAADETHSHDRRRLSFAIGTWSWVAEEPR